MGTLAKSMFREYDIRGLINDEELNEESFAAIVRGYAQFLTRRGINKVVLGYDNRSHSPSFCDIATDILKNKGFIVYNLGLSLSPVVYFGQYALDSPGAMMITASHNPQGWGGVKLAVGLSKTLGPTEIAEVYSLAVDSSDSDGSISGGKVITVNLRDRYISEILRRVGDLPSHGLSLVIDGGNGGAGLFIYELFQALGCKTFQLNCDPDDSYPHYFPNPSSLDARRRMKEMVTHPYIKADLAFGFDGDGDRLGVVASDGSDIWSDRLVMIMAAEVLRENPGATIIYDVKSTRALAEAVASLGGQGVMCPTGHSHVKNEMHRLNAPLAGERSGHIFLGGSYYYGFDDAQMAAAFLVGIMARQGKTLKELLSAFPQYVTTEEISIPCPDQEKYGLVDKVRQTLMKEWGKDSLNTINGVRLELEEGWALLRPSSNLPELVMVAEGQDKYSCDKLKGIVTAVLEAEQKKALCL